MHEQNTPSGLIRFFELHLHVFSFLCRTDLNTNLNVSSACSHRLLPPALSIATEYMQIIVNFYEVTLIRRLNSGDNKLETLMSTKIDELYILDIEVYPIYI